MYCSETTLKSSACNSIARFSSLMSLAQHQAQLLHPAHPTRTPSETSRHRSWSSTLFTMAEATQITKLPQVLRSPTSIQYLQYRSKINRSHPHFKPRFTFSLQDRKHTLLQPSFKETDPLMPPYPYGEKEQFPEANFGLYGGSVVQSGNKISKGRNKGKTLRHWFPNVRVETVRSEALDRELKLPITARVMRTIRKCGGLDEYVTGNKPARIKELGLLGWKLRWLVLTSPKHQAIHADQLRNLPKHYSLHSSFEESWNNEKIRSKMIAQQDAAWEHLRQAAERFENHVQRTWIDSGEKELYKIPTLGSLNQNKPSTLKLPETLWVPPRIVPRTARRSTTAKGATGTPADHRGESYQELEPVDSPAADDLREGTQGQDDINAQDNAICSVGDDLEDIRRRMEAVKEMLKSRGPEIEEETSMAKSDVGKDGSADSLLAKEVEDQAGKSENSRVEGSLEQR